ncbi:MAG: hypothetical protein KGL53_01450, partial [Elusimicrobia bacterium]|nr:hypothetical protein [Elusimicrobiota bacterium]
PWTAPCRAELALAAAAALLALSPWLAKNAAFYGNPVFPYLQERFARTSEQREAWLALRRKYLSAAATDWRALDHDAQGRDPAAVLTTWGGLRGWLLHPWTFSTRADYYESDFMGPLFLCLLPLAALSPPAAPAFVLLAVLCAALWAPLSLVSALPRFFVPCLAPLSLLLAGAAAGAEPRRLRPAALLLSGVVLCGGVLAAAVSPSSEYLRGVVSGRQGEADFLRHGHPGYPTPPYAGIEYIDAHAAPGDGVMLVGDARGLYLRRPYTASSLFSAQDFEDLFDSSRDPQDLERRLREEDVRYFLFNCGEIERVRPTMYISVRGKANYDGFWLRHTEPVFAEGRDPRDHQVLVYKVLDDAAASRPHPTGDVFATVFHLVPLGR